ncbi:MAG: glycoside hydrolase family protein [Verrucomicrobiota bacterium]
MMTIQILLNTESENFRIKNAFKKVTTCCVILGAVSSVLGKERIPSDYSPPEGLVPGGAFIDRILPAPLQGNLRSDVWGAQNVLPRDVSNGIEDEEYSYWGGNIITGDDGKEHLFVCRWPENITRNTKSGHRLWWDSTVVHAVSDSPMGPFKVIKEIGKGHNPEIYRLKDGSYLIGVMGEKAYQAASLEGPWTEIKASFQWLDKPQNNTNRTYVVREDGTVLTINKRGHVLISENADEQFKQITPHSLYPRLNGGHLEDPVIWKDEVQYHLLVNECYGRFALYLRSPDGIHWKWDQGKAFEYHSMRHEGGTREGWYKLERPKVRQDQYGRATHINFAAIDTIKSEDLANDIHSSKNVILPLIVPRRMVILNQEPISGETEEIKVKIFSEPGFNPITELDASTLKFGAPETVNFGGGYQAYSSTPSDTDLIVTFRGEAHGITDQNFAAKMLGRTTEGEIMLGHAKLAEHQYKSH